MSSVKELVRMDKSEKHVHRAVVCEAVRKYLTPATDKGYLVTLGGLYTHQYGVNRGKLIHLSEMWYILNVLGWPANRIISVDAEKSVVELNSINNDPQCKGILNIYMPLTSILSEGNSCPVKRGETGGIEKVVKDLVKDKKKVSAVLTDFCKSVKVCGDTLVNIMLELRKQRGHAVIASNFNNSERVTEGRVAGRGKYNVSDELWNTPSFRKVAHGAYKEFTFNLNDGMNTAKQFSYTGNIAPMQTFFLHKEEFARPLKEKAVKVKKEKKEKAKFKKNKTHGKFSRTIIKNVLDELKAGKTLAECAEKRGTGYQNLYMALKHRFGKDFKMSELSK